MKICCVRGLIYSLDGTSSGLPWCWRALQWAYSVNVRRSAAPGSAEVPRRQVRYNSQPNFDITASYRDSTLIGGLGRPLGLQQRVAQPPPGLVRIQRRNGLPNRR